MSEALEALERARHQEFITDSEQIRTAVENLLAMNYQNLAFNKKLHGYIVNEIEEGFRLSSAKIASCSVREMLMLMACEPGVPWYEISGEDNSHFRKKMGKDYCSAGHSFTFAVVLLNARKANATVAKFMKIGYRAFADFLMDIVCGSYDGTPRCTVNRFCMTPAKLREIVVQTDEYMRTYGKGIDLATMTIGNVIEAACLSGTSSWVLGSMLIDRYLEKITASYSVMNSLFMYCIREVTINEGMHEVNELLHRCSESGRYEYMHNIEFQYCFRPLEEGSRSIL